MYVFRLREEHTIFRKFIKFKLTAQYLTSVKTANHKPQFGSKFQIESLKSQELLSSMQNLRISRTLTHLIHVNCVC